MSINRANELRACRSCCLPCRRVLSASERADPAPRWLTTTDFCQYCARPITDAGRQIEETAARRAASELAGVLHRPLRHGPSRTA